MHVRGGGGSNALDAVSLRSKGGYSECCRCNVVCCVTLYLSTRRWQTFDATFASIQRKPALVNVRSFTAATPAPAMSNIIDMRTCGKRGFRVINVLAPGV